MKKQITGYLRAMTGRQAAARGLTVYPDDTFLVSFPRSGNTWTRFLVCNLMKPDDPVTFAQLESRIPEIYYVPNRKLRTFARPRVIKSHECFDPRYPRVIYIVRDPRDVLISYYEFQLKRRVISDACSIEEFLPRFMRSEIEPKIGCWRDHVVSWTATRGNSENFLFLHYEDMLADTPSEATKIAAFLGLDCSPERIARAVALSSADRMRKLEKEESKQWSATKKTRQDKAFVRKAESGGWKSLPEHCVAQLEAAWGDVISSVGYQLVTRRPVVSL
ncbi:MAG TPA: sulfotransferase domain-containing protein [Terriglobales bacterium]|nr:sulfotransferase domain-containing protein [Terriglobales bacterium]